MLPKLQPPLMNNRNVKSVLKLQHANEKDQCISTKHAIIISVCLQLQSWVHSMTMHILNCSKFLLNHNGSFKDTMWFLLTFEDKLLCHTQLFSQETIWHVALGRLLSPDNCTINMSILQLKTAKAIYQNKACESILS